MLNEIKIVLATIAGFDHRHLLLRNILGHSPRRLARMATLRFWRYLYSFGFCQTFPAWHHKDETAQQHYRPAGVVILPLRPATTAFC